ncbi:ABC transporter permease [Streptomyces sp. TRM66268-LWL]|uniref:ABC transporter permease n=1 Tax=Streptomyces polyasparticus TaxID=2767826 RepID=A0ABR7SSV9_9ACTN|nr:ABC transporter permease [Streptomyces polyasparticus]MBC9717611.1 ABC transporter permease [Streptomyces polyasparticus]
MGARFALTGGREGWLRTALTAVGVGLGVALLLLTATLPNALGARDARGQARWDYSVSGENPPAGERTLLVAQNDTMFRGEEVRGRRVKPEGADAVLIPGVAEYPADGEMLVSPALKELLGSADGKLLRERLDSKIVGTIGSAGLVGPAELVYVAVDDTLRPGDGVRRLDTIGVSEVQSERMDPVLLLIVLVVFIALLMPVAVFIAAAVRFGGERRDRRLAALRLVGADGWMTRRIAAGEALAGAGVGLVHGAVFFAIGRQAAGSVEAFDISVFPHDLSPAPLLVLLVALAVPAAAVAVTLLALRGVVIEPLGVVRTAKPVRRRLWWRLLLPLLGLGLLAPMIGQGRDGGEFNQWLVTGGVVLLLVGITALLPWSVEAVVRRLGGGSVSWQLAVRRLQLSSGTAARLVNGIAVAVAGAIALQMLFAGVESDYEQSTGQDVNRADMQIRVPLSAQADEQISGLAKKLADSPAVASVTPYTGSANVGDGKLQPQNSSQLTVGSCAALRTLADVPGCKPGDVFAVENPEFSDDSIAALSKPGRKLYIDPAYPGSPGLAQPWTLPAKVKKSAAGTDPMGSPPYGLLATPEAFPEGRFPALDGTVFVQLDKSQPDAVELVRNMAAAADPRATGFTLAATERSDKFSSVRTGLFAGATCVLLLIGASLLVSQMEQLRDRKKLLSALVAFGTRRRTLSLSVLWQTAIPVILGLALSLTVGVTLGAVLLKMTAHKVSFDWPSVLAMSGIGAGVVLGVTLLSLPPLLRMMRPEGLRTE